MKKISSVSSVTAGKEWVTTNVTCRLVCHNECNSYPLQASEDVEYYLIIPAANICLTGHRLRLYSVQRGVDSVDTNNQGSDTGDLAAGATPPRLRLIQGQMII